MPELRPCLRCNGSGSEPGLVITSEMIRAYMTANGWTPDPPGPGGAMWSHPDIPGPFGVLHEDDEVGNRWAIGALADREIRPLNEVRAAIWDSTNAPISAEPGATDDLSRAVTLLEYALHLCMHGENAPGGNETWSQWGRNAELFLRGRLEAEMSWFHADGTECVAGHYPDTMLCAEGGGVVSEASVTGRLPK